MTLFKTLLITFMLLVVQAVQGQTIEGVVLDTHTFLPVSGAQVKLKREGIAAITNNAGEFSLLSDKSSSVLSDNLIVMHKLYWKKELSVNALSKSDIQINLQAKKPRLIITTDLGGEDPDDLQSLIHALLLSNEFDLQGIIYGHAWVDSDLERGRQRIESAIDAYAKVYTNLKVHSDEYPSPEYLRSIVKSGQATPTMAGTGEGKDSQGSALIIDMVDENDDPRPIWLNAWGGANTIAQAFWKISHTRSAPAIKAFVNKLRVYDILGQDDSGSWIAKTFPEVFYIRNINAVYGWAPDKQWVTENIKQHGPLGALYPYAKWAFEGDSPAFLHLAARGLNDPDEITQGGWGGRFGPEKKTGVKLFSWAEKTKTVYAHEQKLMPYALYTDTQEGINSIKKWQTDIHNSLAARLDWTTKSKRHEANHFPVAILNGDITRQILEISIEPGQQFTLDASGSSDSDGNTLHYSWQFYRPASSYKGEVEIHDSNLLTTTVKVPADASGKNIHILLVIHDDGLPSLAAYRRVILNVN